MAFRRREEDDMVKTFDHVTIVVRDIDAAKRFFALLGFKDPEDITVELAEWH
jgi:predicted lactoylglutathione lyase